MGVESAYAQILFNYVSPTIAVLIITLNVAELFYVIREKRRKTITPAMVLLGNLAAADMLIGVLICTVKILLLFPSVPMYVVGLFMDYLLRISLVASVLTLLALTLLRLVSIKRPFHMHLVKQHLVKIIMLIWIVTVVLVSGIYFPLRSLDEHYYRKFRLIVFTVFVYPAVVAFCLSYYLIISALKQQRFKVQPDIEQAPANSTSTTVETAEAVSEDTTQTTNDATLKPPVVTQTSVAPIVKKRTAGQKRAEQKVFRVALQSVIALVVCWFPFATFAIVRAFIVIENGTAENTVTMLAFLNSVVDPILYFISIKRK